MYKIIPGSKKIKRDFKKLLKKLSPKVKEKLKFTLECHPYPQPVQNKNLCRIEKKGHVYCYEATGSNRILFRMTEKPKRQVIIVFAGNHDDEIRWLKSHNK